ncbi:hypothetical protein DESC_310006 [Desulfosarcina cetonica]|nr:hypothetical protein DESC_310006 [Desulfosarcina cetonica]
MITSEDISGIAKNTICAYIRTH